MVNIHVLLLKMLGTHSQFYSNFAALATLNILVQSTG